MTTSFPFLIGEDFDFKKPALEDAYFAFTFRLPFRIRVSSPYHAHFENRGKEYDIWIKNNPVDLTNEEMWRVGLGHGRPADVERLWSTVAVIRNGVQVTTDELAAIQNYEKELPKLRWHLVSVLKEQGLATLAVNSFIIGYHTATGELWAGNPLHVLTFNDFLAYGSWSTILLGIPLSYWTPATVDGLFDLKPKNSDLQTGGLRGEFSDLPAEKIARVEEAIERANSFYFYELAFEAKVKWANCDYIGALLMAVAALEGAHGAFVNLVLESRLPENRTGEDKNLEENFIKELGFSLCNRLTPYLFMEAIERPSEELIQRVATAIKYRNEVMHALRNASGAYRIRNRTDKEFTDAYSAALELWNFYRTAVEMAVPCRDGGQLTKTATTL